MNWSHFILLLTGGYLAWYSLNIAADLLRAGRAPAAVHDEQAKFFFDDDVQPQLITYEEAPPPPAVEAKTPQTTGLPSPGIEHDGGLSLKELIRAAQSNLIEFTGAIPY